jgi:hypothetical protein
MDQEQARRKELEEAYGKVYTTPEATEAFEFISFLAPFAIVVERSTGKKGTLQFDHMPRFYYDFRAES